MGADVRKADSIDSSGLPRVPLDMEDNPYGELIRTGKVDGPGYTTGADGKQHFFYCAYEGPRTVSSGG